MWTRISKKFAVLKLNHVIRGGPFDFRCEGGGGGGGCRIPIGFVYFIIFEILFNLSIKLRFTDSIFQLEHSHTYST